MTAPQAVWTDTLRAPFGGHRTSVQVGVSGCRRTANGRAAGAASPSSDSAKRLQAGEDERERFV